jgi:hypothetical protein
LFMAARMPGVQGISSIVSLQVMNKVLKGGVV